MELSLFWTDQPKATVAPEPSGETDPEHRIEGSGAVVPTLSQARQ
jgi:hypothetical protein